MTQSTAQLYPDCHYPLGGLHMARFISNPIINDTKRPSWSNAHDGNSTDQIVAGITGFSKDAVVVSGEEGSEKPDPHIIVQCIR